MPLEDAAPCRTMVDLLGGGLSFEFQLGNGKVVRIGCSEDLLPQISGYPFSSPEKAALRLYPAFLRKFHQIMAENPFEQYLEPVNLFRYIFNENRLSELLTLMDSERMTDSEKIKAYIRITRQNIFADPTIPTSIRLIAEATGLQEERIHEIARQESSIFRIVENRFLVLSSGISL